MPTSNVVTTAIEEIRRSRGYNHPFLVQLHSAPMIYAAAVEFAAQWYKAASAHKKSFPGLIYNTPDDRIRLQLIEILREEYGYGDEDRIHSKILQKFLRALNLQTEFVFSMPTEPEIAAFACELDEAWLYGEPIKGFGIHFALEYLAANMQSAFFVGVQTLGLYPEDIEYFQLHNVAEPEHAKLAADGMVYLATNQQTRAQLLDGVRDGARLITLLLDGLHHAYQRAIASSGQKIKIGSPA